MLDPKSPGWVYGEIGLHLILAPTKKYSMKTPMLLLFLFSILPFNHSRETWNFDIVHARTLTSVVVNHEEQYSLKNDFTFTKNGKDILLDNISIFFSMDVASQEAYLLRTLETWKDVHKITVKESKKLKKLITVWASMYSGESTDQDVIDAANDLSNHATTPALVNVMDLSGANDLAEDAFEVNKAAVIMAGLWGGIIGGALVSAVADILEFFIPSKLAEATKSLVGYAVDAGIKIGSTIAKGVSIGAQWIGHGLKKIFGKKGGKKGKNKSVIALPNGQGDCCGLPFPAL